MQEEERTTHEKGLERGGTKKGNKGRPGRGKKGHCAEEGGRKREAGDFCGRRWTAEIHKGDSPDRRGKRSGHRKCIFRFPVFVFPPRDCYRTSVREIRTSGRFRVRRECRLSAEKEEQKGKSDRDPHTCVRRSVFVHRMRNYYRCCYTVGHRSRGGMKSR